MSSLFFIGPRRRSHLTNKYYRCGYFKKLYLYEDLATCEKNIKKSLGVGRISSIDGVQLSTQELENNELLFFDNLQTKMDDFNYPFHYTLEFDEYLKEFFENFKKNIAGGLLSIKISEAHSDKVCSLKKLIINSYCKSFQKFPKLENMTLTHFKNIFGIVDKLARYIKSCVFSKDCKINNIKNFLDEAISMEGKVKEPILEEYKGKTIVVVKQIKDDLFNIKTKIETKIPEKFTTLKLLKSFIPWENVERVNSEEGGAVVVVIYVPEFKDCFSIKEEDFNKMAFDYCYNKLELKNKKKFRFENGDLKINEQKIEDVKYLFIDNVHVFYKLI